MFTCWESQHDFLRVQSAAELCVLLFCSSNYSYTKVSPLSFFSACSLFSSCSTKQMYIVFRECCISYTFIHSTKLMHLVNISRNVLEKVVIACASCCRIQHKEQCTGGVIQNEAMEILDIRKYFLILSSGSGTVSQEI